MRYLYFVLFMVGCLDVFGQSVTYFGFSEQEVDAVDLEIYKKQYPYCYAKSAQYFQNAHDSVLHIVYKKDSVITKLGESANTIQIAQDTLQLYYDARMDIVSRKSSGYLLWLIKTKQCE